MLSDRLNRRQNVMRKLFRACFSAVVAAAFATACPMLAQEPTEANTSAAAGEEAQVKVISTRQRAFSIPVSIDTGSGATPKEVQLLISTDHGVNWSIHARQPPGATAFKFRADADGEYWFTSRTIDEKGRGTPAGGPKAELKVLIDGTPPVTELMAEATPEGRVKVTWKAQDFSIRADGIRIEYQAGEPTNPKWLPVPIGAKDVRRNETAFWGQSVFDPTTPIRVIDLRLVARDGVGNSSSATSQAILPKTTSKVAASESAPMSTAPITAATSGRVASKPTSSGSIADQPARGGGDPFQRRRQTETTSKEADEATDVASNEPTSQSWPADNRMPSDVAEAPVPVLPAKSLNLRHNRKEAEPPPANDVVETQSKSRPVKQASTGASKKQPVDAATEPTEDSATTAAEESSGADELEMAVTSPFSGASNPKKSPISGPYTRPFIDRNRPIGRESRSAVKEEVAESPEVSETAETEQENPVTDVAADSPSEETPTAESSTYDATSGDRPRTVNDKHIKLDYDLDGVGPAGVKAVELWGSKDGGKTWDRWGEDDDKRSPFEIHVESEATFGFCMVVVSNNGLASKPPQAGDTADVWLIVDTTKPTVTLEQAGCGQGEHAGKLDIRWKAEDAHLGERPISILFSEKAEGPWVTVAAGLPNSGQYYWAVDSRTPRKLFLKIECRDEAGNIASDMPAEPIGLEGLTPKGRIKAASPQSSKSNNSKESAFKTPLFK
jgi:hypothetical protein